MSTPDRPVRTKAQQLAAEATEAADVRDALTHPDVVALRVERIRARVDRFIWTGMVLGLAFTMTNVQQFTAHTIHAEPGSLGWWAAWLLDPTVSVILLGVLLAEREVSRWREPMDHWARVAKWGLLGATYLMNTWQSWADGNVAGIVLHSVPVLAVFVGAEAVTSCNDALTRAVQAALTQATERAERKAKAEREKRATERQPTPPATVPGPAPVPIAPPAAPVFPGWQPDRSADRPGPTSPERSASAAPDRSEPASAGRSADRSESPTRTGPPGRPADRSAPIPPDRSGTPTRTGAARKRTGKPVPARTDAELSAEVRHLAERNGGPPTAYQLKQRFGIGSSRAARLLAELATTTPAADAVTNGARKGGTRDDHARA